MKNILWVASIACLIITASACRDNKKAKNFNEKTMVDQDALRFITAANEAGLTEIKVATVAEQNSKNQRVIDFAKMMITDHAKAGKELKTLATGKYVTLDDKISKEHQAMINELSKKTGTEFDKQYMLMMQADHEKTVQDFETATNNKNLAVKDFANQTLPTLKMHLDSAKAIASSLK
ncbi:DUF4142 domain-containing protein [Mucilaginibacter sp. KACC 22063]|uniref:DUF4142 domain-containing protein n=1 Tax=Mucilaginibacter sp. KACC 22063 TaxID=3025666 RepID=UPI00236618CB|nr:DUF4142 domain-containing protein [Mucilaginibacter sp. KACC 22063]WDF53476.1 DUF4142 domain-containing protein [Mucilaginibacter sp. KACC 22063]